MAKAGIRKAEEADRDLRKAENDGWKERVGKAIERTRTLATLTLKEFAAQVGRDERQVARWIDGTERPQIDAIFAVDHLRGPLVIALAELAHDIEVITEIRIRRKAS
jgi:transcriptional regulator with XRE-family HTH domain